LDSEAINKDIEALEQELSSLRARVDEDNSSFSALEAQVAEVRQRLSQTQENLHEREQRLAEKKIELEAAQRLERLASYERDLGRHRGAAGRVAGAANTLLEALKAYDKETVSLRKLVDEMRAAFGDDDERVRQVEAELREEPEELRQAWDALLHALERHVEARPESENGTEEDLSHELQTLAKESLPSRMKDYFSKS
jgi:predicted  nucleic acid-binding Zn-ribbon protein